jgi:hypothetical protein
LRIPSLMQVIYCKQDNLVYESYGKKNTNKISFIKQCFYEYLNFLILNIISLT